MSINAKDQNTKHLKKMFMVKESMNDIIHYCILCGCINSAVHTVFTIQHSLLYGEMPCACPVLLARDHNKRTACPHLRCCPFCIDST